MLGCCTGRSLHMHAPLERQLVVRSHTRKSRHTWIHGFKIHEIKGVLHAFQLFAQFRCVIPRLSRLDGDASAALALVEREVVGNIVNGHDAHLRQFLHPDCVDSREIADVIVRPRRIAAVVELARDGIGALASRRNVRSTRHRKNGKLRTQLESQLGIKPCDSARQVPDSEEPSSINRAALKT